MRIETPTILRKWTLKRAVKLEKKQQITPVVGIDVILWIDVEDKHALRASFCEKGKEGVEQGDCSGVVDVSFNVHNVDILIDIWKLGAKERWNVSLHGSIYVESIIY